MALGERALFMDKPETRFGWHQFSEVPTDLRIQHSVGAALEERYKPAPPERFTRKSSGWK